ncbi:MAG: transketolase C-terminal domain-containing protein [Candidatus Shapirobacteria bacterium]|nr:transketolase C-terminal domain-containing protein [Candidatus Shapirobacteria bacterium]MDD5073865.1 transketolase C-terminal domain-containing protein [Candidatus Shapirobacteria bacterium]MDD5481742.1 transketolase C-terminal domain-containing protein [Candidatus Shapirobacteria bacterium]
MVKLKSQRDAYGEALLALAQKDERVLVLSPDLGSSTRVEKLASKLGEDRFFNLGVAEQNAVSIAAGLALEGFVPFLSSFAVFIPGRAFDQIRVSVCQNRANVKLVGSHLGFSNAGDGASAQSIEDLALMRVLPEMVVLSPADADQARSAVFAAAKHQGPVYIRISRDKTAPVDQGEDFVIGRAEVLRLGKKATIIATGPIISRLLNWVTDLDVELINCATIKPLDEKTIISSAKKTGRVITIEEHSIIGGLGSAVAEALSTVYPVPVKRIGIPDCFGQSARKPEDLYQKYGLTKNKLKKEIMQFLEK